MSPNSRRRVLSNATQAAEQRKPTPRPQNAGRCASRLCMWCSDIDCQDQSAINLCAGDAASYSNLAVFKERFGLLGDAWFNSVINFKF